MDSMYNRLEPKPACARLFQIYTPRLRPLWRRILNAECVHDAASTYSAEEVRAMREAEERLQQEVGTYTTAAIL